jgi:protein O-GlcNAc transferase
MPEITLEQALQLAAQHHRAGRLAEAESICRQILAVWPNQPDTLDFLGILSYQAGQIRESENLLRQAIAARPNGAGHYGNLGGILLAEGRFEESAAASREALRLKQDKPEPFCNLSSALLHLRRLDEAIECLNKAVALLPSSADLHSALGNALLIQGDLQRAAESFHRALAINPSLAPAHNNLGNVFKEQGRLDEAIDSFRRALAANPDFPLAHSNLIFTLLLNPANDKAAVHAEHRAWNQRHARPFLNSIQPHLNDRDPARPLRIGYVSPDFREHSVARFLLPLLQNHQHQSYQAICYADVALPDMMTEQIKNCSSQWRSICGLSDEQLAGMIRADRIDILVDLSLHSAGNRLLVFARKPAPVQVTYLGYCGTTGMDTIDYRLTDPYLDPPGLENPYYSERSIHLPHTFWCYQAPAGAPEPGDLPAVAAGHITFGCLNNFCKVSPPTLSAWCRLLRDVRGSRLLLHSLEGGHRQRIRDFLAGQEVDPQRLRFIAHQPIEQYLGMYRRIDIALDPFPYNGGTTTCDALWMGVPVVSLAGRSAMGRAGLSILSNVGLPGLVAHTEEEYVGIAKELACDPSRLAELRRTLRQRMQSSPLMDAPAFARDMETAYRQMWRTWCAQGDLPCPR